MPANVRMSDFEVYNVLEYISFPCLALPSWEAQTYTDLRRSTPQTRSISLVNGASTWNDQGQKLTGTYVDVQGSAISYKPPPNTNFIIYRFQYAIAPQVNSIGDIIDAGTACSSAHFRFQIDGVDVQKAYYTSRANRYNQRRETFEWVIRNVQNDRNISLSEISNFGVQRYWGEEGRGNDQFKTLRLVARGRITTSGSRDLGSLHTIVNWSGVGRANIPAIPVITITAIGGVPTT